MLAPHSHGGFTTGEWEGDTLTTVTTHAKLGDIKRHRGFSSDRATFTMRFNRHGDLLTATGILEDPVYLAEPYVLTEIYRLTSNPNNFPLTACEPIEELPRLHENPAFVPHYRPGKHPAMNEMTEHYNIPLEAVVGGPETMYPDIRKKLKDKVRPPAARDRPGRWPAAAVDERSSYHIGVGTFNVRTDRKPGILWFEIEGFLTVDDATAYVAAHKAAVDSFGDRDYKVFGDIRKMSTLSPDCAALFESAKKYQQRPPQLPRQCYLGFEQRHGRRTTPANVDIERRCGDRAD